MIKNRWFFLFLDTIYIVGLMCFLILLNLGTKNIFLTYSVIILSIILLLLKLSYWYFLNNFKIKNKNENTFLLKLLICVFTYLSPTYCIIQEPYLITDKYISLITISVVIMLAIIGILIENIFLHKLNKKIS